tara:strand:- start:2717 stop:3730 length:1014 start_codon:yes stop_codon:yes gene_type:complete
MNVNVLNVAKEEYTAQLTRILSPLILQGIESIYEDAKELSNEQNLMRQFQELLKEVPKWNNNMIKEECQRILQTQDWMHELVTAVFVTNVKILTSVKLVKKQSQFKLKMPSFETFIHAVYIEIAKTFFDDPFVMYHNESVEQLNKNRKNSLKIIKENIEETIRILLPVQNILQEYMRANEDEEPEEDKESEDEQEDNLSGMVNQPNQQPTEGVFNQPNQQSTEGVFNQPSQQPTEGVFNQPTQPVSTNGLNEVKNLGNDIDNESIISDEEYEDAEDKDGEYAEDEDGEDDYDENVRSVSIRDKKSLEKIKNNMNTENDKGKRKMRRYDDEDDDEDSD